MTIHEFVQRVCSRAEENMERTGKLEGSHYNAMMTELKLLGEEEDMTLEHTKQLYRIMGPLEGIEPMQLRRVAAELVGRGGEYTACGRCIEAAIEILYPDAPKPVERRIGFEEGYGGMTFPVGGKR